jgi:hypothetical protein
VQPDQIEIEYLFKHRTQARPEPKKFNAMADDHDAAIESRIAVLFPTQERIVIRSSAELIKVFRNKMCVSPPNFS